MISIRDCLHISDFIDFIWNRPTISEDQSTNECIINITQSIMR